MAYRRTKGAVARNDETNVCMSAKRKIHISWKPRDRYAKMIMWPDLCSSCAGNWQHNRLCDGRCCKIKIAHVVGTYSRRQLCLQHMKESVKEFSSSAELNPHHLLSTTYNPSSYCMLSSLICKIHQYIASTIIDNRDGVGWVVCYWWLEVGAVVACGEPARGPEAGTLRSLSSGHNSNELVAQLHQVWPHELDSVYFPTIRTNFNWPFIWLQCYVAGAKHG